MPNEHETLVEHMLRRFLTAAQQSLIAATTPGTPDAVFRWNTERATLTGMCAYLLDALYTNDQGEADEVATALLQHCSDGEPLADWVSGELTRRGIDVEALIQEQRGTAGGPQGEGELTYDPSTGSVIVPHHWTR